MSTTAEKIAVMQAFEDGREVEMFSVSHDRWISAPGPSWNWDGYVYRIKPEPRKVWIIVCEDGSIWGDISLANATLRYGSGAKPKLIEFIEVLKEPK